MTSAALGAQAAPLPASPIEGPVRVAAVRVPDIAADSLPGQGEVRHLRLEIEPPELGACELELTVREADNPLRKALHAVVIAERPQTVAALREAEPQIRQALADQSIEVGSFEVAQGSGNGSEATGGQPPEVTVPDPSAERLVADPARAEPAVLMPPRRTGARWAQANYVDVFA